jgi:AcrR family transcriptional regulator
MLRDALIDLVAERGYDAISVADIADRADINRATFYLHYGDKEELLVESMEAVFNELAERLKLPDMKHLAELSFRDYPQALLFQHVGENAAFYRAMLGPRGVPVFAARARQYIAEASLKRMRRLPPHQARISHEAVAQFSAGALLSLMTWWVERGCPESVDEMAAMYLQLVIPGVYRSLGIEHLLSQIQWEE